jgi:hypothetical protein
LGDARGNAATGRWRLTSSQYRATRQPYTAAISRAPIEERVYSGAHLMRELKHEYAQELASKYPKKPFDHFESGDKIELVCYLFIPPIIIHLSSLLFPCSLLLLFR